VLQRGDRILRLEKRPMELLILLVEKRGELVSREQAARRLWGADVFVDVDHGINTAVRKVRMALRDDPVKPGFIETVVGKGYRFVAPVTCSGNGAPYEQALPEPKLEIQTVPAPVASGGAAAANIAVAPQIAPPKRKWLLGLGATLVVGVVLGAFLFGLRWKVRQTSQPAIRSLAVHTVVLADFVNTAGDPVFDEALKQALAVQLGQSPFLNILSDTRVRDTVQLMNRPPDARLDLETAREICLRTGSAAVLSGSIARLGNQYVLGLNAVNCETGDALARDQVQATGKEQVLGAMDGAVRKLRGELGESLDSIQKFDTPVEQATTSSFEALKAFSLGLQTRYTKTDEEAIPLFQRAVKLDPEFAMAYGALGTSYGNLNKDDLAMENIQKAYELRDRASEREKFRIAVYYFVDVTGNLGKMRDTAEQWVLAYPRDWLGHGFLGDALAALGHHERGAEEYREALRLNPDVPIVYAHVFQMYLALGQLDEAEATLREGEKRKSDYPGFHFERYVLAFLRGDAVGMKQQVAWAAGKPGSEDILLALEADTAAYYGRLTLARELSRRAVASAQRAGEKEIAAGYEAHAALREALLGNSAEARRSAAAALSLSKQREVEYEAALALGFGGDVGRAQPLADDLARRFPEGTWVQSLWVPTIRAQFALERKEAAKAIELLQAAVPYELEAVLGQRADLHSAAVRGNAYMVAHKGNEAASGFQRMLDHPGILINQPIGVLTRVGLARAYALEAQSAHGAVADAARAKARTAYQDFLTLWKDADPDIPILRQAKAEYAKLQ